MITIIVEAWDIPLGSTVRKPTGQKHYILKDKIEFHGDNAPPPINGDNVLFLVCQESINCIPQDTKLAVDFESTDEARVFLDHLDESNEP